MSRTDWQHVLDVSRTLLTEYDTPVTLRQLHYRLVALGVIRNTTPQYKTLSDVSAKARRAGTFPALIDGTRTVRAPRTHESARAAQEFAVANFRVDRTEGQDASIYLGVEKRGLVQQLDSWFGAMHLPIVALAGYSSQSHIDQVARHVESQDRPAVLLYAGDFDPSGEDIDRDFEERTDCFDIVQRVALSADQVEEYDLPPQMGKVADSRAAKFVERHGALVQVELDALPMPALRELFTDAIATYWDVSEFERMKAIEAEERAKLQRVLDSWDQ